MFSVIDNEYSPLKNRKCLEDIPCDLEAEESKGAVAVIVLVMELFNILV